MDINTVMILRRSRKPEAPSANNTALRIRYHERGTPVISIELLAGQHHRAQNGDQDQHGYHLEGQQVLREKRAANVRRSPVPEGAEMHAGGAWKQLLDKISHQSQKGE